MTERHDNERTDDEREVEVIEMMRCPVDDELYQPWMDTCPTHDKELVPVNPEEDSHLL